MTTLKTLTLALLVALAGALSAVALAACGEEETAETTTTATVTTAEPDEEVEVDLLDFRLVPDRVEVREGEIEFVARNEGDTTHELAIETPDGVERTGTIQPNETGRVRVELDPGQYVMYDPLEDHRTRGMQGTVVVQSRTETVTEQQETVRERERTVTDEQTETETETETETQTETETVTQPPDSQSGGQSGDGGQD